MTETFEGVVLVEFDEGMIPDVVINAAIGMGEPFVYDTLHGRLKRYAGQRVRITIEALEGDLR